MSKLERIVNVNGLLVASTRKPSVRKQETYQYAPNEVWWRRLTTTYFSHDLIQQAGTPGQSKRLR